MDKLKLDINDASAGASINPQKAPLPAELEDIINTVEEFFKQCGTDSYLALKSGLSKNAHAPFRPSIFLKNINLLLYNFLKENNKNKLPILKAYFDGMNEHLKVLDSLNLKLEEKDFVSNIIGYTINCYKNNTFKVRENL